MSKITIHNSKVKNSVTGNHNLINIEKQKASWFFSGFVLPIAIAFITEFIKQGQVSEALNWCIRLLS